MEFIIDEHSLEKFSFAVLETLGANPRNALDLSEILVWADRRGLVTHGAVRRLSSIVQRVQKGGSSLQANISVRGQRGALRVADANNLWGQLAARRAMEMSIESAQNYGVGITSISNTSSGVALGYYPTLATAKDMIGILITNSQPLIAVPDTSLPVLGNQAHAFGFPRKTSPPLIFDSSLTKTSTSRLAELIELGSPIPFGVLKDNSGSFTQDPKYIESGSLEPIGGYKGFGLALAFELLTAGLAASEYSSLAVSPPQKSDKAQQVSMTAIAIDGNIGFTEGTFSEAVTRILDEIRALQTGPVRFPGDARARSLEGSSGLRVKGDDLNALFELSTSLGVEGKNLLQYQQA